MESRKQLIVTGAFLLIGVFVILVTILMLGGDRVLFEKMSHIYISFDQVQGLNKGSVVSLAGLPIGNIDGFEFDNKTQKIRVSMKIQSDRLAKLNKGTNGEIRTQGALGDKFIYITPGSADQEPLTNGAEIEALKSADIMAIIGERGNETERIFEIIKEVHILTKSLNEENRLGKVIRNLESGTLAFSKMASTAETSMNKFDRVIAKIDRGDGTLGQLISDPSIHDQIKNILGGSQRKNQVKDMLRRSVEK